MADKINTWMQPGDFGYGAFLVERNGQKVGDNGVLTVLNGANPDGTTGNAGLGLDYYDVHGGKRALDQYLIKGDKGYYNLLSMIGKDQSLLTDSSKVDNFIKDDPTAAKQAKTLLDSENAQRQRQANNEWGTLGATLAYKQSQNTAPNPLARPTIGENNPQNDVSGLSPLKTKMAADTSSLAMTPQSSNYMNQEWIGSNIAKFESMPTFVSHDEVASGAYANAANERTRRSIGKPTGGYGVPVFNLLSGSGPAGLLGN